MEVMLKRFVMADRIAAGHTPSIPPLPELERRESAEGLIAFELTEKSLPLI